MPVKHDNTQIICQNVGFAYPGAEPVLRDVSFSLEAGEYVGIVGPNGGGKSTLLHLLAGILHPTKGDIRIFGHSTHDAHHHIDIGFVPQRMENDIRMFPATVEEIVQSGRVRHHLLHGKHEHDDEAAAVAIRRVNIEHLRKRRIGMLSGGEFQRVMIARALCAEPEILLLDEPTVGVDRASQETFYSLLRTLHQELHLTILLVSHDIAPIRKDATRFLTVDGTVYEGETAHTS